MKIRTVKIAVDALMFLILVFELLPTEIIPVRLHFFIGFAFTALMFTHIALNWKWCAAVTKALLSRKASGKVKAQYVLNWLLLIIWSLVALTGLPAMGYAMSVESGETETILLALRNAHVVLAVTGTALIAVHIYQHRKQIRSYFHKALNNQKVKSRQEIDNANLG